MTRASTICRYLLGAMFAIFGANGFLHFIPLPPPATPLGQQFMTAAATSHFLVLIFAFEVLAGLALLAGRFVPLALVVLAGILINVLDYHLTMDPAGVGAGILATVLWFVTASTYRATIGALFTGTETAPATATGRYVRT